MNLIIFFLLSLIFNLILIYFLNKKKIRKFFYKSNIQIKDITKLHKSFELNTISNNLKGPKKEAIIKSFNITSDNDIVGMTSDYEAWILSTLSKTSKNIFEFGTCSGKTTYLMALNSSEDTKITSLTLDPGYNTELIKDDLDSKISHRNIIKESIYEKFLFSGTNVENKIKVIFGNSLEFDHNILKNKIDLVFIDGGHTYSIVKNDTDKSFDMLKSNGIIIWHDYVPGKKSSKDIVKYLNEISKDKKIYQIKNTSMCFYQKI